ncbi:hypothetical protein EC968_005013 [Mortierella alpina]|nr:hypothetical protein EC968_005013 [Mortierella alpina]
MATNDFFEFVYDCILFEYAGFGPVKHTTVYLVEIIRAFAYIAKLYAQSPTSFSVQQNVFLVYKGLNGYTRVIEDDIPEVHPLFPATFTKVTFLGPNSYVTIFGLPPGQREQFLWRYARQVPAKYQDDIALLIQKLRRDVWFTFGRGKDNVKIYRQAHNQAKIKKQLLRLANVEKNAVPVQGTTGGMVTQNTAAAVGVPTSRLPLLDRLASDRAIIAHIDRLMRILQENTVSTPTRVDQVGRFTSTLLSFLRVEFAAPRLQLHITGSYANGLCGRTSDVDVTLTGPTQGIDVYWLAEILSQRYEKILTIAKARVPIVTFWHRELDISCDISINQELSIHNSKLVKTYEAIDPRVQTIWFSLKHLAKKQGILSAKDGFLSSYALTMMLITYLQTRNPPVLPRLQVEPLEVRQLNFVDGVDCSFDTNWRPYVAIAQQNKASAGELLVGFLRYFGHQFDYARMEIDPRRGQFQPLGLKRGEFRVMDPFLIDRNVAGMCKGPNVQVIKRAFQTAHQTVLEDTSRALATQTVQTTLTTQTAQTTQTTVTVRSGYLRVIAA